MEYWIYSQQKKNISIILWNTDKHKYFKDTFGQY